MWINKQISCASAPAVCAGVGDLQEPVHSSHMRPSDWTQVAMRGSKRLCLVSYLHGFYPGNSEGSPVCETLLQPLGFWIYLSEIPSRHFSSSTRTALHSGVLSQSWAWRVHLQVWVSYGAGEEQRGSSFRMSVAWSYAYRTLLMHSALLSEHTGAKETI